MPGHPVTSYVLCTDPGSRLLLVRGPGAGDWQLPGGAAGAGESPLDAVRRGVRTGLGLVFDLLLDDLLGVEWAQARRPGAPDGLVFLWSGPMLSSAETDRIVLRAGEWAQWRWAAPEEARRLLDPDVAARVRARPPWSGGADYRENRCAAALGGGDGAWWRAP
ncbi:NUDIX domain-containing protein [Kitasatospora sp. NPDC004272]